MKVRRRKKQKPVLLGVFQPPKERRWDLYVDGVSSSLLQLWMTCREQFRLAVVEGWTSKTEPIGPAFGSCVHWILRKAYQHKTGSPGPKRLGRLVDKYEKLWLEEHPVVSQRQLEQQEKIYTLVEAVMPQYFKYWGADWTKQREQLGTPIPRQYNGTPVPYQWLALEERFDFGTMPYANKKKVWMRGAWDGVFLDTRQRLWVLDTKCWSVIQDEQIMYLLPFDFQFWFYLFAVTQVYGDKYGPPHGIVVNVVRRPGHKQGKIESLKEFGGRVAEDVAKRPPHSFIRYALEVTPKEIEQWKDRQLMPVLEDLRLWWEGKAPHYLNPQALTNKYGTCSMFAPITQDSFFDCYQKGKGRILDYQTSVS